MSFMKRSTDMSILTVFRKYFIAVCRCTGHATPHIDTHNQRSIAPPRISIKYLSTNIIFNLEMFPVK